MFSDGDDRTASARRYAIYWAPPEDGVLWRLGSSWLGRDAATGTALARPTVAGLAAARIAAITDAPARYGLHATLAAPFALRRGASVARLHTLLTAFAARRRPFPLPRLTVGSLDGFVALLARRPSPPLADLAAGCVRIAASLRAPPTADERARRRRAGLTPRQDALLLRWGYPYVFDQWRFHVTLTGHLGDGERRVAAAALARLMAPALAAPIVCDGVCLFMEPAAGQPLRLIARFPFTDDAAR